MDNQERRPNGYVFQISASSGGVPKRGLYAADVTVDDGIVIDDQEDKVHHGGPLQKLCLFRLETIQDLQKEGHPIFPGSVGENLTVSGIKEEDFRPGYRWKIGREIEIELTMYATPCRTIKESFADGNFNRINSKKHPGWSRLYARVITDGRITTADPIYVIARPDVNPYEE